MERELLQVCAVIERCIEESENGIKLLDAILEGELLSGNDLPLPSDSLRKPPKVQRRQTGAFALRGGLTTWQNHSFARQ